MGYIAHNAIVVTAWDEKRARKGRDKAVELGCIVTEISEQGVNGYVSFLICPDGSKEGWEASAEGDDRRLAWKVWAKDYRKDSGFLDWVEVRYSGDDQASSVVEDAWTDGADD